MKGWFRAETIKREDALKLICEFGKEGAQEKFEQIVANRKALALTKALIGTHRHTARRVYEENTDGGIYKLFVVESGNTLASLGSVETKTVLWLLPNENDGITLMFPEDY